MQKVLLVAVAILFALGVLTSYQKHILDYRVSAITETEFGQASAIEHREYLLRSCQSGTWKYSGGSTVHTGLIGNGQQIPLPNGFIQNQCSWSVSNSENPHGWKPNYFAGQVATADANRIVKCGYYDEYNFHPGTNRPDLSGKCSFIISCS